MAGDALSLPKTIVYGGARLVIAEKVGASFRYPRCTIHGTIGRMSTPIIAIVCALGVIVPLALGFLPSQRKRRATRH
ncbi:hypothetical protein [Microbacterium aurum]